MEYQAKDIQVRDERIRALEKKCVCLKLPETSFVGSEKKEKKPKPPSSLRQGGCVSQPQARKEKKGSEKKYVKKPQPKQMEEMCVMGLTCTPAPTAGGVHVACRQPKNEQLQVGCMWFTQKGDKGFQHPSPGGMYGIRTSTGVHGGTNNWNKCKQSIMEKWRCT